MWIGREVLMKQWKDVKDIGTLKDKRPGRASGLKSAYKNCIIIIIYVYDVKKLH